MSMFLKKKNLEIISSIIIAKGLTVFLFPIKEQLSQSFTDTCTPISSKLATALLSTDCHTTSTF